MPPEIFDYRSKWPKEKGYEERWHPLHLRENYRVRGCDDCEKLLKNLETPDEDLDVVGNDVWDNRDFAKEKQRKEKPHPEETILDEAKRYVYGDREADYGHPKLDFERIATLWRAYFVARGEGVVNLGPEDVARMMILLKMARLLHTYHHDSAVDMAGYAATLARLEEE